MEQKYENDIDEEGASGHLSNFTSNQSQFTLEDNNVDDMIRKYKNKISFYNQYSYNNLYRNVGNHELLNTRTSNSVENHSKHKEINTFIPKMNKEQNKDKTKSLRCRNNSYINKFTCNNARLTSDEKVYHDKTTYCRPVLNYYNEQFIYKTMERNARLKSLVKKLVIARQREKETVSWNNFINDLKNRHGINTDRELNTSHRNDEAEEYTPEIIDDYYKTRFSCIQSKPCSHLLQDFYGAYNEPQPNLIYDDDNRLRKAEFSTYLPSQRNPFCYPTSSQARLLMDRRKDQKQLINQRFNNITSPNSCNNPVKKRGEHSDSSQNSKIYQNNYNNLYDCDHINSAVQTNTNFNPDFINKFFQDKSTYKTDDMNTIQKRNNSERLENIINNKNNLKQISLTHIDKKLEVLISSINAFVDEIKFNKANRRKNKYYSSTCNITDMKDKISLKQSESNVKKYEKSINKGISIISENTELFSDSYQRNLQKVNEDDTNNVQRDINYKPQTCTYIDFEVPTKDNTTEVTQSLSKQDSNDKEAIIEEINLSSDIPLQRMTIAVNTDPLSLLSLLRISTDTLKQFLSYMPNIDYYSYLSLLQFPQARRAESRYICNICGSNFDKPSQLSDHIRGHNLGKTRDCCVCRHVLDLARKYPGLFRCQYCGQLFARAYCCELHQESCAKRFGKHHDVDSNLVLLR